MQAIGRSLRSIPPGTVAYANRLNAMHTVVFSKTLARVEWNNTILVKEIVPEAISQMKQEPGCDMVIYGSASIARALTNLGSVDRYQLLVYPVVLGGGQYSFKQDLLHPVKMKLVSTRTHPSAIALPAYQPIKKIGLSLLSSSAL